MANYLITGGCGFIGTHLASDLVKDGHRVRVVDDLSTGAREKLPQECELMVGDIRDGALLKEAMEGMQGCYHLAAIASVQESNAHWLASHRVNQTGTINVLEAAQPSHTPVIYASSAAVYGDNAEIPLKENTLSRPLTPYGADKLGSEMHARVAGLAHDIPTIGLRLFNVYGSGQNPNSPYSGVISIFIDRLINGEPLTIYGDGQQTRDFIYVKDVVRHLRRAMDRVRRSPMVFNVCTGTSVSINQLAQTLMSIFGVDIPAVHRASRRGDIRVSVGDPARAIQCLGVSASYKLSEGLRELVDYELSLREGKCQKGGSAVFPREFFAVDGRRANFQ